MLFSTTDRELIRRLEAAVAEFAAETARCTAGASLERIAGGWALFAGTESPLSHAVGIGMNGPVAAEELERLERFYQERGAAAAMDVAALADPSVFEFLAKRRYCLAELAYTLCRQVDAGIDSPMPSDIRVEDGAEPGAWARVVARGFSGGEDPSESVIGALSGEPGGMHRFLAYAGGEAIAGAAMSVSGGVAWLAGDATLPAARNHGAQGALLRTRLVRAAELGCDLAAATVLPGSGSHRNYERAGFRFAYAVLGVRLECP
jgi:GNAT superfamily N-acetyltransferase